MTSRCPHVVLFHKGISKAKNIGNASSCKCLEMITVCGKLSLRIQIYMCHNAKWMAAYLDVGSYLFSTVGIWHPETMFVISLLMHFGCNSMFSYRAVESDYSNFRFCTSFICRICHRKTAKNTVWYCLMADILMKWIYETVLCAVI